MSRLHFRCEFAYASGSSPNLFSPDVPLRQQMISWAMLAIDPAMGIMPTTNKPRTNHPDMLRSWNRRTKTAMEGMIIARMNNSPMIMTILGITPSGAIVFESMLAIQFAPPVAANKIPMARIMST